MRIKQTVVVEGKDDESAVLAALDANVICTSGYGLNQSIIELIAAAYERTGIVVFTDPDHAGRKIRERLTSLFPAALQAHLTKDQAEKAGDIGIENAKPDAIINALKACGCDISDDSGKTIEKKDRAQQEISMQNLIDLGLAGADGSTEKRSLAGAKLGVGSANAKTFLKRLNYLGIGLEELINAIKEAAL